MNEQEIIRQNDIFDMAVFNLVNELEKTQWLTHSPEYNKRFLAKYPVMTREDLKRIPVVTNFTKSTSGSTGEPIIVDKTIHQKLWHVATNIRELIWRGWDTSKNVAYILPTITEPCSFPWELNKFLYTGNMGTVYGHPTTGKLQEWLDSVPCDYLFTYPSIAKTLDVSKFTDVKTGSEMGSTSYSCEEAGTIALTCPDNPDVMHVMENIILEIDENSNVLITDLTHPHIKRYMLNDVAQFATCHCGRGLQTISSSIIGRIRNLAVAPDGSRYWPVFGTISMAALVPTLHRFQAIQKTLYDIELKVTGTVSEEDEKKLIDLIQSKMGKEYNVTVTRIESFPTGKHEEFICLL